MCRLCTESSRIEGCARSVFYHLSHPCVHVGTFPGPWSLPTLQLPLFLLPQFPLPIWTKVLFWQPAEVCTYIPENMTHLSPTLPFMPWDLSLQLWHYVWSWSYLLTVTQCVASLTHMSTGKITKNSQMA